MTIQQLEYILAVDQFRHFARAAEYCRVTQPTLSAMIQKLEDELGVKLFDRTVQPVCPTPIGQKVIDQARVILAQAAQVKEIISEPLLTHKLISDKQDLNHKIKKLLLQTGLTFDYLHFYPNELSGGQKQRLNITRCLALNPKLIIADEPVASLDLLIQAQIINLLIDLQKANHFSCIFIAHDLSLLRFICHRIGVMYQGHLVELAPTNELFLNPQHDYTKSLISTICTTDPIYERTKKIIYYQPQNFQPKGLWLEISPNHFVLY
mgnify:CR=1 FL=1